MGSSMLRGMATSIAKRVSGRGASSSEAPLTTDQSTMFTAIAALRTQTQRDIGHQVSIGRIYRTLGQDLTERLQKDAASRDRALSQATTVVDTVTAATQALGRANQRLRRGQNQEDEARLRLQQSQHALVLAMEAAGGDRERMRKSRGVAPE